MAVISRHVALLAACGFIHFFIEGSFVLYLDFHADKGDKGFYWSFMASLWKEYANADSRCDGLGEQLSEAQLLSNALVSYALQPA